MQGRDLPKLSALLIELGRIARFGIVGVVVTLVYVATTFIAVEFMGLAAVSASMVGQVASTSVSYFGHASFSFGVEADHRMYLWRFLIVAAVTFGLNVLVTYLFTDVMDLNYQISIAFIAILIPLTNYFCNRFWVFRSGVDALATRPSNGPDLR